MPDATGAARAAGGAKRANARAAVMRRHLRRRHTTARFEVFQTRLLCRARRRVGRRERARVRRSGSVLRGNVSSRDGAGASRVLVGGENASSRLLRGDASSRVLLGNASSRVRRDASRVPRGIGVRVWVGARRSRSRSAGRRASERGGARAGAQTTTRTATVLITLASVRIAERCGELVVRLRREAERVVAGAVAVVVEPRGGVVLVAIGDVKVAGGFGAAARVAARAARGGGVALFRHVALGRHGGG